MRRTSLGHEKVQWHSLLFVQRAKVSQRLPWQFDEALRLLLLTNVDYTREMSCSSVPVRHLEVHVSLTWLLAEKLPIEGMSVLIRLAMRYVPSIIPLSRIKWLPLVVLDNP